MNIDKINSCGSPQNEAYYKDIGNIGSIYGKQCYYRTSPSGIIGH